MVFRYLREFKTSMLVVKKEKSFNDYDVDSNLSSLILDDLIRVLTFKFCIHDFLSCL
jgi:hypothetical protein